MLVARHRHQQPDLVLAPVPAVVEPLLAIVVNPVLVRRGPIGDLQPPAVRADHGQVRRRHAFGNILPLHQRQRLIRRRRRVALGTALGADRLAHPTHFLVRNWQIEEFLQIGGALLIRRVGGTGVNDLGLHRLAVRGPINSQALGLREKKPADSGGRIRGALAIRRRRFGS